MTALPMWAEVIVGVAVLLGSLATIKLYVWPALKGAWYIAKGIEKFGQDYQSSGGFGGLNAQNADLAAAMEAVKGEVAAVHRLATASHHELHPNGGGSMRDSIDRIERKAEELREHASANRAGIEDLRDQANDLSRRLTDVDSKAAALSDRQETLRTADQQLARDLQHYVETEHRDLVAANEHLRAALNEALSIEDEDEDQ